MAKFLYFRFFAFSTVARAFALFSTYDFTSASSPRHRPIRFDQYINPVAAEFDAHHQLAAGGVRVAPTPNCTIGSNSEPSPPRDRAAPLRTIYDGHLRSYADRSLLPITPFTHLHCADALPRIDRSIGRSIRIHLRFRRRHVRS